MKVWVARSETTTVLNWIWAWWCTPVMPVLQSGSKRTRRSRTDVLSLGLAWGAWNPASKITAKKIGSESFKNVTLMLDFDGRNYEHPWTAQCGTGGLLWFGSVTERALTQAEWRGSRPSCHCAHQGGAGLDFIQWQNDKTLSSFFLF